ncbi:hypothetical protein L1987_18335 [Smallanthus sonchifolius]|uniref:Uncharacterized protein n=1 Tax=Smallanthus sonchifolius TaxID=185202 RepID=A0ACB9IZT0_9ASTR|nr:hypothetical protein L1987_18335 [Smallanthus sonchifolius]
MATSAQINKYALACALLASTNSILLGYGCYVGFWNFRLDNLPFQFGFITGFSSAFSYRQWIRKWSNVIQSWVYVANYDGAVRIKPNRLTHKEITDNLQRISLTREALQT